jgi:hypothetical protein
VLQGSPQFTPRQLLDAGRRAEAEGKLDHASQLYRHLTDHYGYTAEAAEARNGLGRLGVGTAGGGPPPSWTENGAAAPAPWPLLLAQDRASDRASATHAGPRVRPVPTVRHYRTGRVLAALASCAGWLMVAAGVATIPLVLAADPRMLQRELPNAMSLGLVGLLAAAVVCSIVGLIVVFWGQMARALFDQANATRELVALERARQAGDRG